MLRTKLLFGLALSAGLAGAAPAQQDPLADLPRFIEARTVNPGSVTEMLDRLRVSPVVLERIRDRRAIAPIVRASIAPLARMSEASMRERAAADVQALRAEGWAEFSFVFGYESGVLTLAENLAGMSSLQRINESFSTLGLLMTAWQINLDLSRNDDRQAALNGYQGVIGFQLARWGTAPIQIANVGIFLMNAALQEFGSSAWLAREDAWRQAYTAYYREGEAAAESAEFGAQPILTPTLDERVAGIRAQTTGGRSVNDWITLFWSYHLNAVNPNAFSAVVQNEVDAYVARFWDDPMLESYFAASGITGIAPGALMADSRRAVLEDEHRAALYARFARDVFPEVAALAAVHSTAQALAEQNEALRRDLNAPIEITAAAFGLTGPAEIALPRAEGGEFTVTLQPGQSQRLRLTRLAWLRAGAPDHVILRGAGDLDGQGALEFLEDDRAQVVFGVPRASNVLELRLTEQAQSCTQTITAADGSVETRQGTRPARGVWVLHTGMVDDDPSQVLLGRYVPGQGWRAASMVAAGGGLLAGSGAGLDFSEPRFDDLARMRCTADTSMLMDPQAMAATGGDIGRIMPFNCTLTREVSRLRDGVGTVTQCTSQARMQLQGALVHLDSGERFAPFSGGLEGVDPAELQRALAEAMAAQPAPAGN